MQLTPATPGNSPILDTAHYEMVRAALGIEVDDYILTDDLIALPIYQGAAETEILRRDPQALSRTGTAAEHIINAAVYLTAALIAPAMTQMKRESFGDYSYAATVDWGDREKELRARFEREMAAVLNPDQIATTNRPVIFAAAKAYRGR